MANPKKKHTHSRSAKNRVHLALEPKSLGKCPKCGKALKSHTACAFCGEYKGRQVLSVKTTKTAKTSKK